MTSSPLDNVVPLMKPPSRKEAQGIIRNLVNSGKVSFHRHAKLRKRGRKITTVQITNCLLKGYVDEDPYPDLGHQGWGTAVSGRVAGDTIRVVVCLRWSQDALVITCYYE